MKKKHTILIVPPRSVSLKTIRIRFSIAVIVIIIAIGGFVGFFIPFKTITNNATEQNQKKNLTEQNRSLLQKIIVSLRMLQDVRGQILRLEDKKESVIAVSGNKKNERKFTAKVINFSHVTSSELYEYVKKIESYFMSFGYAAEDSGNIFDTLPVLKPVMESCYISRKFGIATDPFSGDNRMHYGTDFTAEQGSPVIAAASGTIKRVEKHNQWGNRITIEHCGSYKTVYAHLGTVSVSQGRYVKRGEIIGEIGLSGLTSGPHVHFEIWRDTVQVDPERYFFPIELIAANR